MSFEAEEEDEPLPQPMADKANVIDRTIDRIDAPDVLLVKRPNVFR